MEKLNMRTGDIANENFRKLAEMFPEAVTETTDEHGEVVRAIDKDVLMQAISTYVVEGNEERYQFTWPDKRQAMRLASTPIAATLRPCREESVNFDTTENLYIEGDNLDVLKLLRETYLGKVKMIYIDPPYNTGNDFVYDDGFAEDAGEFQFRDNQYDDQGNRLVQNTESNGRFHTDWLNMIYPRLKVAKDLLADDGVIFISIDDHEQENLKKICDEIFGSLNFVASLIWQKKTSPDARMNISAAHDYILIYAKDNHDHNLWFNALPYDEERLSSFTNPDNDPRGPWASVDITGQTGRAPKSQFYEITTPAGIKYLPPEGRCWAMAEDTFNSLYKDNRLWFGENGKNRPRQKKFLRESEGQRPWTWWDNKFASYNQASNKELMKLFDGKLIFDNPKPVKLLMRILEISMKKDDIVLDFFAGSATTAHAVLEYNVKSNHEVRYICVQVPQELKENGNDFKANKVALDAGYKTICEIGKERIRRAGKKIKEENSEKAANLDIGFRVLKLDSSNMEDVYYTPDKTSQDDLLSLISNIKPDRTPEDLLFQVMLELGVTLSSKIEECEISGKKVFKVAGNFLIACFEDDVTDEVVTAIAKRKPVYAVLRDRSFASDSVVANFEQIFAAYSPDTTRKIL